MTSLAKAGRASDANTSSPRQSGAETSGSAASTAGRERIRAGAEPSPPCVEKRVAKVRSLFVEEMAAVDAALARIVRDGNAPGTRAAAHLLEAGGKRVRPLMVILSSACFGEPTAVTRDVAVVVELVHLATLLHDDVIDDGQLRRGHPTSRRVWGDGVSVLAGDLLLTHALQVTGRSAPPAVFADLLATLRRLVDGEIIQLAGRSELDTTEATYFRVARGKTASLFEWAARSGAACAGATSEQTHALGDFGAHVGLAFQLVDDVLDYTGDPTVAGKALYTDLLEGKLTLPLVRALALDPSLEDAIRAVRSGSHEAVPHIAESVRASGVCDGVRALAKEQTARAVELLDTLPTSGARDVLATIARDLTARVS
jgi:octaprenyl-diphosphate synthase